jgi:hypothetical protein
MILVPLKPYKTTLEHMNLGNPVVQYRLSCQLCLRSCQTFEKTLWSAAGWNIRKVVEKKVQYLEK